METQIEMKVRPQDILKGDLINHAGAVVRVNRVEVTPSNYKFTVTYTTTGGVCWYYYRPTDTVKLLSI